VVRVQLDDLTPNIGLHWYFFAEMFEVFRPLWHFVFGAMAAAAVVPVAIRLPHRPLTVAVMQSCATALLKPYPSVTDISQYLVLSFCCQITLVDI
jgi:phosphatidylinositol glycan class U